MKKDNRSFEEVVRSIEMSESDVDKILKAARLARIEKPKMSDDRFEMLLWAITIIVAMVLIFGFMSLSVIF